MDKKDLHNIQTIIDILCQHSIVLDPSPVSSAWRGKSFEFKGLTFFIDKKYLPNHMSPVCQSIRVELGACINNKGIENPLITDNYQFNIIILGDKLSDKKTFASALHIDYDLGKGQEQEQTFIHPLYHLTFGGKGMKGYDLGDTLNIPSPRIPIFPMDVILVIDLILTNFLDEEKYTEFIQKEASYVETLRNSQSKYWKPYYLSIASKWCNSITNIDKGFRKLLLPTLID